MIVMSRKVYIDSNQYGMLRESEWNFHFGQNHDMRPYVSDPKASMSNRETGHFGSGTYFSTYKKNAYTSGADVSGYGDTFDVKNPNFIQVGDGIYRVDFDLYKNLYRVRSKVQGDVLYTMCKNLNRFYGKITNGTSHFVPKFARYDNSELYQYIRRNANALGLRCPSYYELTRMAQNHEGVQSFSTLFMEWNGFNGVNVSGIDYYDNTKHGSVIYDLSKVSDEIHEVDVKIPYLFGSPSYDNTIAYSEMDDNDVEISALRGEYLYWQDKINNYPLNKALRILKNYTKSDRCLSPFKMKEMDDNLLKHYLGILFRSSEGSNIYYEIMGDRLKYYAQLIERVGAYYWVNYPSNSYSSILEELLYDYEMHLSWDLTHDEEMVLKKEYLDKLLSYMERDLSEDERSYIKSYLEEDEDDEEGVQ